MASQHTSDSTSSNAPGLQPERTFLSWSRTALSFVVNGVLLVVSLDASRDTQGLHITGIIAAAILFVFTLLMARHRRSKLRQNPLPEPLVETAPFAFLALGSVMLAGIVLASVLLV